jgi:hypothetical protein
LKGLLKKAPQETRSFTGPVAVYQAAVGALFLSSPFLLLSSVFAKKVAFSFPMGHRFRFLPEKIQKAQGRLEREKKKERTASSCQGHDEHDTSRNFQPMSRQAGRGGQRIAGAVAQEAIPRGGSSALGGRRNGCQPRRRKSFCSLRDPEGD